MQTGGAGEPEGMAKWFTYQRLPFVCSFIGLIGVILTFVGWGGFKAAYCDLIDCTGATGGDCTALGNVIFILYELPAILVLLVGLGMGAAAIYQQGMMLKCCLPCAMVALFIWELVIFLISSTYKDFFDNYDQANYTGCGTSWDDFSSATDTAYAGTIINMLYIVIVTVCGCMVGCKMDAGQQ